jgi:hypothetical protein
MVVKAALQSFSYCGYRWDVEYDANWFDGNGSGIERRVLGVELSFELSFYSEAYGTKNRYGHQH